MLLVTVGAELWPQEELYDTLRGQTTFIKSRRMPSSSRQDLWIINDAERPCRISGVWWLDRHFSKMHKSGNKWSDTFHMILLSICPTDFTLSQVIIKDKISKKKQLRVKSQRSSTCLCFQNKSRSVGFRTSSYDQKLSTDQRLKCFVVCASLNLTDMSWQSGRWCSDDTHTHTHAFKASTLLSFTTQIDLPVGWLYKVSGEGMVGYKFSLEISFKKKGGAGNRDIYSVMSTNRYHSVNRGFCHV